MSLDFWQRRDLIKAVIASSDNLSNYKFYVNDAKNEFVFLWDETDKNGHKKTIRIAENGLIRSAAKALQELGADKVNAEIERQKSSGHKNIFLTPVT